MTNHRNNNKNHSQTISGWHQPKVLGDWLHLLKEIIKQMVPVTMKSFRKGFVITPVTIRCWFAMSTRSVYQFVNQTFGQWCLSPFLKSHIRLPILILTLLLIPTLGHTANLYWVGTNGGNTSTASNWNTTDPGSCLGPGPGGGGDAGAAPGSSDIAIFDPDCDNNATIDGNLDVDGIDIQSGYTGTLTQSNGTTITIGTSDYTQADGVFTGGDATSSIDISGTLFLSNGTFTAPVGTVSIGRSIFGDDTLLDITGGTFDANGGTMQFDPGTSDCCTTRTFTIDVDTSLSLNDVIVNAVSGANRVLVSVAGGDTITATGTFTLTDGQIGGAWEAEGNVIIGSAANGGDGTLTMIGGTNRTYSHSTGGTGPHLVINKTGSADVTPLGGTTDLGLYLFTLTAGDFTAPTGTMTIGRTINGSETVFLQSGGTFDANGGTILFDHSNSDCCVVRTYTVDVDTALTFNNVEVDIAAGNTGTGVLTAGAGDTITLTGNMTHTDGVLSGTWETQGNVVIGANANGGTGTITMTGGVNRTYAYTASGNGPHLRINKTGSADVTPLGGTTALDITAFSLLAGDFTAPTGTMTIGRTVSASETVFIQSGGTFSGNGGTIEFDATTGECCTTRTYTIDVDSSLSVNSVTQNMIQSQNRAILEVAAGDTFIVGGDFTQTDGRIQGTWEVQGNTTIGVTSNGGTADISFTGGNSQTYTDNGGSKTTGTVSVNKSGNALSLATAMSYNTGGQDLTIVEGTLDLNGQTLTVNDQMTVESGGNLQLQGDETVTNFTPTLQAGSTVTYDATSGSRNIQADANWNYQSLTISGSGGTFTLGGNEVINQNLTVTNGTLSLSSSTLGVTGTTTVNGGVLDANNQALTMNGDVSISSGSLLTGTGIVTFGDGAPDSFTLSGGSLTVESDNLSTDIVINASTITTSAGTVQYIATGGTLPSSLSTYHNLTINSTGQTFTLPDTNIDIDGVLTITDGTLTFDDDKSLTVTDDDTTGTAISIGANGTLSNTGTGDLTLGANVTNNGTITFDSGGGGSSTDDIFILSSDGTQRNWVNNNTITMTDVDVEDQSASTSILVTSGTNSGMNSNWLFSGGSLTATSVTPASLLDSVTGNATIVFTTTNDIASDGKVTITFPAGFDISGVSTATSSSDLDGTLSTGVVGQTLTITRGGVATLLTGGSTVDDLIINNVTNPSVAGLTGTFTLTSTDSSDNAIDTGTASGVTITLSSTSSTTTLTDSTGTDTSIYTIGSNTLGRVYVSITDLDEDEDDMAIETVLITLSSTLTSDQETITLTETGINTGIFNNLSTGLTLEADNPSSLGNNILETRSLDTLTASYTDNDDGSDTSSDQATIEDIRGTFSITLDLEGGSVSKGDILSGTLAITNNKNTIIQDTDIVLNLPLGVSFLDNSHSIKRGNVSISNISRNNRDTLLTIPSINANENIEVSFKLMIGNNTNDGDVLDITVNTSNG